MRTIYKFKKIIISGLITLLVIGLTLVGVLVNPSTAQAASCSLPSSNYGTDTINLNVTASANYTLWVLMQAPATNANSVESQIDGSTCFNMGGSSNMPVNTWTWVNYQNGQVGTPVTTYLSAGNHSLELVGSNGVSVSSVLLLSNSSCIPTGNGSNCQPVVVNPPTVSITSPVSGSTATGNNVTLSANVSSSQSISKVEFLIDGTALTTLSSAPYIYNWQSTTVGDGQHKLTIAATDSTGQTTVASENFYVANHSCSSTMSSPQSLKTSSSSPNSITLNWSPGIVSYGCSVKDYNIYRNNSLVYTTTSTSWTDNSLVANTSYNYSIVEQDNDGHSSSPAITTATTQLTSIPPAPPTQLSARLNSNSQVILNWSASTSGAEVTNYLVKRNNNVIATLGPNVTSYTDNSTIAGQSYNYQVITKDTSNIDSTAASASPATIIIPAPVVVPQPPASPTNLRSLVTTTDSIVLQWNEINTNLVTGFKIYRNNILISNQPNHLTSSSNGYIQTYTDSNLSAGTQYHYYVVAYDNSQSSSSPSSTLVVTTLNAITFSDPILGKSNPTETVNIYDLSVLLKNWGKTNATPQMGDVANQGTVNIYDLSYLLSHWGQQWSKVQ